MTTSSTAISSTNEKNKNKTEGKIFVSPFPYEKPDLGKCRSLGHRILDKLSSETANDLVFVDFSSGRRWVGSQLREKILNVATALIDRFDFKQGTAVCISYNHSDYSCIATLAVVCVGGIVACVFPKDPYAEVLSTAEKVGPKFLFCHYKNAHWAKQLEKSLGRRVVAIAMNAADAGSLNGHLVDANFEELLNYDHRKSKSLHLVPVACKNIERDVALVTMSSGTTGKPKAVPTTHEKCLVDLRAFHRPGIRKLRFAGSASLDYISGRLIILGAIESGYTTVIIDGFEPKSFLEAIEKYKINVVYLGAASFYTFISYKELDNYDISSLKMVFPMGAKIVYLDELREFFAKHPHILQVRTGYGASEVCGAALNSRTPEEYLQDCDNCGKLLPGVKVKLVDPETGQLLGPNQEGLLHIMNPSKFLGYYDIRQLEKWNSKSKCILDDNSNEPSPFVYDSSVFDEDGFYITGDIARFNEKEELYIIGRQKELMSCRGAKKVLPQELEEVIEQHPAVSKVCVLGMPNKVELTIHCPRAFIVPKANFYTDQKIELTERLKEERDEREFEEEVALVFKGEHKLCKMSPERRRLLSVDIMEFVNERVGWEKQLTGGIVLIDQVPTLRSTGKINKTYLRSLDLDQIEVYGDRSS